MAENCGNCLYSSGKWQNRGQHLAIYCHKLESALVTKKRDKSPLLTFACYEPCEKK